MKKITELREMTIDQLGVELLDLRKKQFNTRLKRANGALEKTHGIPLLRKAIARVKTLMTEKVGASDGK